MWKRSVLTIVGTVLMVGAGLAPAPASASGTWFSYTNLSSSLCMDVHNASHADWMSLTTGGCTTGNNQRFRWQPTAYGYALVVRHSGKCIENQGGTARQRTCFWTPEQSWTPTLVSTNPDGTGNYVIVANVRVNDTDFCMHKNNIGYGYAIHIEACNSADLEQVWRQRWL